jgi:hypothetical protein
VLIERVRTWAPLMAISATHYAKRSVASELLYSRHSTVDANRPISILPHSVSI